MLLEKRRFYNDKMVNPSGRHIIININAPKKHETKTDNYREEYTIQQK